MAKAKAPPADGEAPKGKGKLKWILLILIGVLLVVGLSVGATWFILSRGQHDAEKPADEAHAEAPAKAMALYEPLVPAFVVNFNENGRQRYMQVSVTLMGRNAEQLASLKAQMPVVRNQLVMLFSGQTFDSLANPVGIEMLHQQATAKVQEVAQKLVGQPVVEQVLFTNFVLQ